MSKENVEIAKRWMALNNERDVAGVLRLMSPDIECFPADDQPEAKSFRGPTPSPVTWSPGLTCSITTRSRRANTSTTEIAWSWLGTMRRDPRQPASRWRRRGLASSVPGWEGRRISRVQDASGSPRSRRAAGAARYCVGDVAGERPNRHRRVHGLQPS